MGNTHSRNCNENLQKNKGPQDTQTIKASNFRNQHKNVPTTYCTSTSLASHLNGPTPELTDQSTDSGLFLMTAADAT